MPAIDYLMSQLNLAPTAIDRFVVAEGPGSYTGLRLGVTTAKTLAYTLKKELVGISSLQTLRQLCWANRFSCASFDARRKTSMLVLIGLSMACGKMSYRTNIFPAGVIRTTKNEPNLFVGEDVEKFTEEIAQIIPHGEICDVPQWQIPNLQFWLR